MKTEKEIREVLKYINQILGLEDIPIDIGFDAPILNSHKKMRLLQKQDILKWVLGEQIGKPSIPLSSETVMPSNPSELIANKILRLLEENLDKKFSTTEIATRLLTNVDNIRKNLRELEHENYIIYCGTSGKNNNLKSWKFNRKK